MKRLYAILLAVLAATDALPSERQPPWDLDVVNDRVYRLEGRSFQQAIPAGRTVTGLVAKTLVCGCVRYFGGDTDRTFRTFFWTGERIVELDGNGRAVKTIHVGPNWLAEFWRRHKGDADVLTQGKTTYCIGR